MALSNVAPGPIAVATIVVVIIIISSVAVQGVFHPRRHKPTNVVDKIIRQVCSHYVVKRACSSSKMRAVS